ncbi:MAG: ABC transporter permease [Bowdeniella nasicola]|nr:ABC transporter permease [Bowdeniella nasicola]
MIVTHAAWEIRSIMRNGEQLMVTFILPIIALIALLHIDGVGLPEPHSAYAVAGTLAMAVIASSFTSQAISIAFDRRWGVLRMFSTTPLGPRGLLLGKAIAVAVVVVVQVLVLIAIAGLAGAWPVPSLSVAVLVSLTVCLGTLTFVALALCIGGTLRPEAVLAVANIAFVLMVIAGGVLMPVGPGLTGWFLLLTPFGALGEAMRGAILGTLPMTPLLVEAVWAVLLSFIAVRFFRWD